MSAAEDLRQAAEILRRRLEGTTPAVWGRGDGWTREGGYVEAVHERGHEVPTPKNFIEIVKRTTDLLREAEAEG